MNVFKKNQKKPPLVLTVRFTLFPFCCLCWVSLCSFILFTQCWGKNNKTWDSLRRQSVRPVIKQKTDMGINNVNKGALKDVRSFHSCFSFTFSSISNTVGLYSGVIGEICFVPSVFLQGFNGSTGWRVLDLSVHGCCSVQTEQKVSFLYWKSKIALTAVGQQKCIYTIYSMTVGCFLTSVFPLLYSFRTPKPGCLHDSELDSTGHENWDDATSLIKKRWFRHTWHVFVGHVVRDCECVSNALYFGE